MSQIVDAILAPASGSYFYDDQAAIRSGLTHDGFAYDGAPLTPGFDKVRIPSAALGIGLVLDDGAVVWGDMVSVQYSGAAGRDPLFDRDAIAELCREVIIPQLIGRDSAEVAANCEACFEREDGVPAPMAIRYGVSQALISAAAHAKKCTMAEVICGVFGQPLPSEPIPIFSQSGDERKLNVDKMILKQVDILPHGLINSREKFGQDGAVFLDYIRWVAARTQELGQPGYKPKLHFDLYGWIGLGISKDPIEVAAFMARCAEAVPGYELLIESPVDYGNRSEQIGEYAELVAELDRIGTPAQVVADEHCNNLADVRDFCDARAAHVIQVKTPDVGSLLDTARAIAYAKDSGIGAYCGGTSAETDLSARICVHVALAMQATMMLAKPGMGVDEGICIVGNEQNRALAQLRHKAAQAQR